MKWIPYKTCAGGKCVVAGIQIGYVKQAIVGKGAKPAFEAVVFGSPRAFDSEATAKSWVEESAKTAIRSMAEAISQPA